MTIVAVVVTLLVVSSADARTLSDRIRGMVPPRGIDGDVDLTVGQVAPASNAITFVVAEALQRVAIRGVDFPVVATVPGFSYVYNPTLQTFERSMHLGPVFAERAETLGRGRFEFGFSYLYADLNEVNGDDLGEITGSTLSGIVIPQNTDIDGDGQPDLDSDREVLMDSRIDFSDFSVEHHWFNFSMTYGITDRWDANLLVPLVQTSLNVRGRQVYRLTTCLERNVADCSSTTFTDLGGTAPRTVTAEGDAFGLGDILARTKYRFLDGPINVAAVLTLRIPTGDEEDFQGLGDTAITPSLVAAAPLGTKLSIYGNMGFEINVDDYERNRVRYAVGGAYQIVEQVALLVDVIGSSSFVDDEFDVQRGSAAVVKNVSGESPNGFNIGDFPTYSIPRSDVVDLAAGAKFSLAPGATAFIGAIVPLTDDGLRAEVIPTGGVEFGF